jgi:excisionase family DNA binding protein
MDHASTVDESATEAPERRSPDAGTIIPPESDRLVLSVSEAAQRLGISRAFAYELVARGELPVIRLGRRRLVPIGALQALVEGSTPDPTSHEFA